MANDIVRGLEYDAARGRLTFRGVRYFFLRPEPMAAIIRGLGSQAPDVLYRAGYEGGVLSGTRYREVYRETPEGAVRFMAGVGGQVGWGAMTLRRLDLERRELVLEVVGSPFAEGLAPSEEPACHLLRGVFGGLAEGLLGWSAEARETACAAAGSPSCTIEVRDGSAGRAAPLTGG